MTSADRVSKPSLAVKRSVYAPGCEKTAVAVKASAGVITAVPGPIGLRAEFSTPNGPRLL